MSRPGCSEPNASVPLGLPVRLAAAERANPTAVPAFPRRRRHFLCSWYWNCQAQPRLFRRCGRLEWLIGGNAIQRVPVSTRNSRAGRLLFQRSPDSCWFFRCAGTRSGEEAPLRQTCRGRSTLERSPQWLSRVRQLTSNHFPPMRLKAFPSESVSVVPANVSVDHALAGGTNRFEPHCFVACRTTRENRWDAVSRYTFCRHAPPSVLLVCRAAMSQRADAK